MSSPKFVKAMSFWQPIAWLVSNGYKCWDTRGRNVHYRGPLAIHAAKRVYRENDSSLPDFMQTNAFYQYLKKCGYFHARECNEIQYGKIVAVSKLVTCVPANISIAVSIPQEFVFGDYSVNRYALQLVATVKLKSPVEFAGNRGLFNVPLDSDELLQYVLNQRSYVQETFQSTMPTEKSSELSEGNSSD